MGRFRKFMPFTAGAHGRRRGSRSPACRRSSGFFSKDEIISQAFLRDDYALWVVGIVAAAFTAVYMTRLIWLTFYGNARYETLPGVTNVPIVSGGSGEDEHDGAVAVAAAHTDGDGDGDPSPTVTTATRCRSRSVTRRTSRRRS